MEKEIVIIGAGMSGLAAATLLKRAGKQILILDKARGVGGRLANRRFDGARFDHGAQFITAREQRFMNLIADWRDKGVVEKWYGSKLDNKGDSHFRGCPSMSAIAKDLAQDIDLQLKSPITAIEQADNAWSISLREGERIHAKAVIMTPPVPQSLAILNAGKVNISDTARQRLENIHYKKCIAVMVRLDGPSLIPSSGYLKPKDGPIAWMADNQAKGISEQPAVTIHATSEYSEANWEGDRDLIAKELIGNAEAWLSTSVVKYQIHGWRYSKPISTSKNRCEVISQLPPLLMAGDAFTEARVEGAALSGWAAAEALLQLCPTTQKTS